jgi:serine/threonine protein kinase
MADRLATGTRLGPYELVASLGAGGMGEVYRARDTRLGREVAIKLLAPAAASDPDRLRRFQREAIAASALNHPNVVTVYDVGQSDYGPFLATELIDGVTLRRRLERGSPTLLECLDIAIEVALRLLPRTKQASSIATSNRPTSCCGTMAM